MCGESWLYFVCLLPSAFRVTEAACALPGTEYGKDGVHMQFHIIVMQPMLGVAMMSLVGATSLPLSRTRVRLVLKRYSME
jgi:hypothetical protein